MTGLLARARCVAAQALETGALVPLQTRTESAPDQGVPFRLSTRVSQRPVLTEMPKSGTGKNPFLPYDPALCVSELGETHICLLNKYPVLDQHLLVVTRGFEEQERLLDRADLNMAAMLIQTCGGLVFYNGGEKAGASQRHRHLQWVPIPLAEGETHLPMQSALSRLPFTHGRIDFQTESRTEEIVEGYYTLLRHLALDGANGWQAQPYNLLLTREWVMLIPRREECWEGISVNALGYAGSLFAPNDAARMRIREVGGMTILRALAY